MFKGEKIMKHDQWWNQGDRKMINLSILWKGYAIKFATVKGVIYSWGRGSF